MDVIPFNVPGLPDPVTFANAFVTRPIAIDANDTQTGPMLGLHSAGSASPSAGRLHGDDERRINRYSLAKIRLSDPAIGELRITGAYRASDTAGFARALAASFGLGLTTDADGDIVLDRPVA